MIEGIKAFVLDLGATYADSNWLIAMDTVGTNDNRNATTKWAKAPNYAVLIQHPTVGWILYDTGSPPDAMLGHWPSSITSVFPWYGTEKQTMIAQLAEIGLKPEDIKIVVLSHYHMDHAGNLSLFKNSADVYIAKAEAAHALLTVHATPDPAFHGAYVKSDVEMTLKKMIYVDKDMEIAPGIKVIILPGHTPAVLGIMINTGKGNILAVSDAVYTKANYDGKGSGITYDSIGAASSLTKIKELAKEYNAEVWFGHDPDQFDSLKKPPEYYG